MATVPCPAMTSGWLADGMSTALGPRVCISCSVLSYLACNNDIAIIISDYDSDDNYLMNHVKKAQ